MRSRPSFEEVAEWLRYDPESGNLYWRKAGGRNRMLGTRAGSKQVSGYINVKINQHCTQAHRVCWLLAYGKWPENEVDHINGIKWDNRLFNLRDVTTSQNQANRKPDKRNRTGLKGVTVTERDGISAKIHVRGKHIHLGTFRTVEDAAEAYRKASLLHFGEHSYFARHEAIRRRAA